MCVLVVCLFFFCIRLIVLLICLFFCRPYGEDDLSSNSSDDEYEDGHGYASEPTAGIMDEVLCLPQSFLYQYKMSPLIIRNTKVAQ